MAQYQILFGRVADTTYLYRKRQRSELSFDLFSRPSTNLINALNGVSVGMPSQAAHDRSGTTIKMVIPMNCLICVGVAERIQCSGPWEERDCPDCGRYRVSDELILTLMEQGQIFDVSKTRGGLIAGVWEVRYLLLRSMKRCCCLEWFEVWGK